MYEVAFHRNLFFKRIAFSAFKYHKCENGVRVSLGPVIEMQLIPKFLTRKDGLMINC
jgi:hypothetical protein